MYSITLFMARIGMLRDNVVMEFINGWIKAKIFMGFHVTGYKLMGQELVDYIVF